MQTTESEPDEASLWITLSQVQGLGNAKIIQLLTKFGSPDNIFSASTSLLKEVVSDSVARNIKLGIQASAIQPTLDWLQKDNTHIVTLADNEYPKRLLQITKPPAVLYAIGDLLLKRRLRKDWMVIF